MNSLEEVQQQCCSVSSQTAINGQQSAVINDAARLDQNIPNPFNHTTTINYTLPQKFNSAEIIVSDKAGKVLKEINISGSGKGSLKVDASTLSSGAYQYSLYVDGRLIETKQMMLAK
jgi:LAS superfamily LD-carboxypeptidase LdcB